MPIPTPWVILLNMQDFRGAGHLNNKTTKNKFDTELNILNPEMVSGYRLIKTISANLSLAVVFPGEIPTTL